MKIEEFPITLYKINDYLQISIETPLFFKMVSKEVKTYKKWSLSRQLIEKVEIDGEIDAELFEVF